DIVHSLTMSRLMSADGTAVPILQEMCAELARKGAEVLAHDGVAPDATSMSVALDMRYPGQAYEIQVPLASPQALPEAVARFHQLHMQQYAHAEPHVTPQIVAVRLAAIGRL